MDELVGRSALITGASRGFGLAVATAYVDAGADVMICGRDAATLEVARLQLEGRARPGLRVLSCVGDVSHRGDVDAVVGKALGEFPGLDVLVNNAGIYGPKGTIESVSSDEWAETLAINLLGSVWMCAALMPHFRRRRYGKIVQLSGGGATAPLPRLSAYAASKAAVVRFAETLAEEAKGEGIDVNSIAPGALNTRMLDEVLEAGAEAVGEAFFAKAIEQKAKGGAPLAKGAALAVFLGSAASDGITGRLISAIWDPWERLPEHRDALRDTDVYTLRRIVAADRGLGWGTR